MVVQAVVQAVVQVVVQAVVQEEARRVGVARHGAPGRVEAAEGVVADEEPRGLVHVVQVVDGALRRQRCVGVQQVEARVLWAQ